MMEHYLKSHYMVNQGLQNAKKNSHQLFLSNFLTLQREKSCKTPDILFEYYFVLNFTIEICLCSIVITHVLIIIIFKVGNVLVDPFFFLLHSYFHFCDKYIFWKKMLFFKIKNDVKFLLLCLLLLMLLVCFCFYLSFIFILYIIAICAIYSNTFKD